jgi:pimeloyl-ACP methyl ester carboxylesterase
MHDVQAILDEVGSARAALFGVSEGGPMSLLYAATYPARTSALVLYGSYARRSWAPDYPFDWKDEQWERLFDITAGAPKAWPSGGDSVRSVRGSISVGLECVLVIELERGILFALL